MESRFEKWLDGNVVVLMGIVGLSFLAVGSSTMVLSLSEKIGTGLWMNICFWGGLASIFFGADTLCQIYDSKEKTSSKK